jgi:hypothetical protein
MHVHDQHQRHPTPSFNSQEGVGRAEEEEEEKGNPTEAAAKLLHLDSYS